MEYQLIEEMRKELNQLGNRKPLNDPDILKLSQKLDGLLNEYQKLQYEKSLVIQEVVMVRKKKIKKDLSVRHAKHSQFHGTKAVDVWRAQFVVIKHP